jgi:site-specific DNA-methyltransferase (adenine-specific)
MQSQAQIEAFEDTWHWGQEAEDAFDQVLHSGNTNAADLLRAMRSFLGENDMMAYLAMMAVRLIQLHRVLKPTGSLYLHCDPTASHYLKIVLDSIFGPNNFRNEIIWKRSTSHGNVSRAFGSLTDTILFYSSDSGKYVWNQQHTGFPRNYIEQKFRGSDSDGRRWQSVWFRTSSSSPIRGGSRCDAHHAALQNDWVAHGDFPRQAHEANRRSGDFVFCGV